MLADLAVFARDFPEVVLLAQVEGRNLSDGERNAAVAQLARQMWGANCHYGLLVTPEFTYVLRDTFTASGPEAVRVAAEVPTEVLLGGRSRVRPPKPRSEEHWECLVKDWLHRLTTDYEKALPDHAEAAAAFFPEIVGTVAEGRVVAGAAV